MSRERTAAVLGGMAVLAVVVVVSGGAGASPTATTVGHGAENGNYTVSLPFDTDHYPRDENPGGPYNGSINHYAAGTQEVYDNQQASDGIENLTYLKIENQDIDFSQCSTSNTAAFGIDRDNDDSGTQVDTDLLRYLESNSFNAHSIEVNFYEGDELAAPNEPDEGGKEAGRKDGDSNAELYPDDEIVAHQGYKSGGGPCYGMPEEPGWYQIGGFVNGTSFSGSEARIETISHYFYICVCASEQEAREKLGPPPSESGSTEQTATPEPTPTEASGGDDVAESTPTATDTATETAPPTATDTATATAPPTATDTATATDRQQQTDQDRQTQQRTEQTEQNQQTQQRTQQNQQPDQPDQQGGAPATPTAGAGPGFGLVAALGGVLVAALLARRRD